MNIIFKFNKWKGWNDESMQNARFHADHNIYIYI